jgi:hypothetical protein
MEMDDFNPSALHESKNEWCARLVTLLTPQLVDGFRTMSDNTARTCAQNNEPNAYFDVFQKSITEVPKWSSMTVEAECARIAEKSQCAFLQDLVACVHIVQLKILTAMRVGHKQKKIAINIPKLDVFIHKAYINCAREIYKNAYLFERGVLPLQRQKLNRELEVIVQSAILNTIRDSIPVENILKVYMDESVEEDTVEQLQEEMVEPPQSIVGMSAKEEEVEEEKPAKKKEEPVVEDKAPEKLSFSDVDFALTDGGQKEKIAAPKDIPRLEEISTLRNEQRKREEEEEDDNEGRETLVFADAPPPALVFDDIAPAPSQALVLSEPLSLGAIESI